MGEFCEGAVLNRGKISVHFLGSIYDTIADEMGNWSVILPKTAAGGPYEMELIADNWYQKLNQNDKGLENREIPWYSPQYEPADWATMEIPGYWADNPEHANLYNKEYLPASPFRTDEVNHEE